ncbi:MAG: hypothetical protein A3F09_04205 [Chlamydiae bacterium RIFCSPHIGHO2_12_FULL_49_11]|nr:MAG: hypothetical protein A3F09_04205 [Chlamydiae bacterium RIFCSPHIGHO2_12_FULL_49_11]
MTQLQVLRFARRFFSGTLLSRITGMAREMLMLALFGASEYLGWFLIAFRLSHFFRRIFGEGALLYGFIPAYERELAGSKREADLFFRDSLFSVGLLILMVVLIGEGVLYVILQRDSNVLIRWMMLMLPGLFFISLYAFYATKLEMGGRFFLPAVAPVVFNVVWIGICLGFYHLRQETFFTLLAVGTVAGFFFQWLVVFGAAAQGLDRREWLSPRIFTAKVRGAVAAMGAAFAGIVAGQFNSAFDIIFAGWYGAEGPVYLNAAQRVFQLPIGLFSVATATALMPSLARAIVEKKGGEGEVFQSVFRSTASLGFFICALMCSLAPYGINLLYGHGSFTAGDVAITTFSFIGYMSGFVFTSLILIFTGAAYALEDYKSVVRSTFASVAINTLLNFLFIAILHRSVYWIAIATTIASMSQLYMLYVSVIRKRFTLTRSLVTSHFQLAGLSIALYFTLRTLFHFPPYFEFLRGTLDQGVRLVYETLLWLGCYVSLSFASGRKELYEWIRPS